MIELNQDSNELTLELVSENVSFGGGNVEDVYQNGTSVVDANRIAQVTTPTKTSDLTNDGDGTNPFLTTHQSLANYSTTTEMNTAIANHHDSTKYDASNPNGYITSSAISGKENTSNKVTSLSSSSTDTQYPSAKCVYDIVGNVEALLEALL